MFIDLDSQIFTKLIFQIGENSSKLIKYFIDKSLEKKKEKQDLHFNNQFLNFSNMLTSQKILNQIPLSTENFKIIQHQQRKRFQEIILPGSLIGHFSNFPSKQLFRTAFFMEIGEGKELQRLSSLRNFCLDGIVIQEWNISMLVSLADVQQHFYFLIRGDKQLSFFLYFWQRIFQQKSKTKIENSRKINSFQINIFLTQNQKFFVNLQMSFSQEQQLLIHQSDIGFQYLPIECYSNELTLDKTLQTSVQQGLNKADYVQEERQLQIYSIKSPLLPISNQAYNEWMIDSQLFSEQTNNKECSAQISSEREHIQLDSFGQGCHKEQWLFHRIDIYNGIDGEDNRQIVFSVDQFQKRYAKSVCTYQELQRMKRDLSEFVQQEQDKSSF